MMTTEAAMDLTTQSPREIDEKLAALYDAHWTAGEAVARAWQSVHYAAGDKHRSRFGWAMSDSDAFAAAEALRDAAAEAGRPWRAEEIGRTLESLIAKETALAEARDAMRPFEAEFAARPWSRFFIVSGGHIHSSMSCPTCNKGRERTRFGWMTDLSGKSMAEAIEHFEQMAKGGSVVLCTVCFPDAPVFAAPVDDTVCAGSGTWNYDRTAKDTRVGYYGGNGATCSDCGQWTTIVKGSSKLRKHKKGA